MSTRTRSTPPSRPRSRPRSRAAREERLARRLQWATRAVGAVVAVLVVALAVALAGQDRSPEPTLDLPNPMGGEAVAAPYATGQPVELGDLQVEASEVQLGDVPLNVTVVSRWQVANPTDAPVAFTVGQPRVHEGCCPGPVYVDGDEVAAGGSVTVAPGTEVIVQFPLQMHPGMDGPHHLTVPLEAGGAVADLHVTGNFTATA